MKLLLVCFCATIALALSNAVSIEFKKTAEIDDKNRFETSHLTSDDEEKRLLIPPYSPCGRGCESGFVKSKYCKRPAKLCFKKGQTVFVRFTRPFLTPPKVMIGLSLIDAHRNQNVRVRAEIISTTTTGFYLRFKPWDKSITYQIGVNWMACR